MAVVFKNNAKTTLASGINSSATSITVSDGSVFPSLTGSDIFFVTFDDGTNNEIVKVTARSGNTLTVVRAQESTTARSFSTGDEAQLRLTAGILGLFSQTGVAITDEIEAYLDANGTTFPDNVKAQFGASNDLQIFHDGSDSFIKDEGQGNLRISSNGAGVEINKQTSEYMIRALTDGAVELYHNNSKKLETTSSGVTVTGGLHVGTVTTGGNFTLDVGGDIIVDADGGDVIFKDDGTEIARFKGEKLGIGISPAEMLDIQSASGDARIRLDAPASSDTEIKFFNDGTAQYTIGHDDATDNFVIGGANVDAPLVNVNKSGVLTANAGVVVDNITIDGQEIDVSSGDLTLDVAGDIFLDADGGNIKLQDGGVVNLDIYKYNSNVYIENPTGDSDIIFQGTDGSTSISALTLDMSNAGAATFNNTVTTNSGSGSAILGSHLDLGDNQKIRLGASDDLQIFHDGNHSRVKDAGTGNLVLNATNLVVNNSADSANMLKAVDGGAVTLYHNGSQKLVTSSSGVSVTGSGTFSSDIDVSNFIYVGGNDSIFAENNLRFKSSGAAYIDHNTTGQNINFRVSNSSSLDTTPLIISSSGITVAGGLDVGTVTSTGNLVLNQDSGTIFIGADLDMRILHDGSNGTFRNDTGNLTVDVGGDIIFDAGGQNIYFDDDGTRFLSISQVSSDVYIGAEVQDKDLIFRGNDGGSTITALTLDMSEAGKATFNNDVVIGGNLTVSGDTITANVATLDVEDKNITLNKGSGDTSSTADGAGITIQDAVNSSTDASLTWNAAGDKFIFSHKLRMFGTLELPDNVSMVIGDGEDLVLKHTGSNSVIHNTTGQLRVRADSLALQSYSNEESYLTAAEDGAVNLFHNNVKTFETTSTGIKVDGPNGNVTIGALNTSGLHIYTDRGQFYFNKRINIIENDITSYDGDFLLKRAGTTKLTLGASAANFADAIQVGGTTVIDSSRNLTNISSITVDSRLVIDGNKIYDNPANGNNKGISFGGGGLVPINGSGTNIDNVVDIGHSSYRFKDLHLSGTISSGAITSSGSISAASLNMNTGSAVAVPKTFNIANTGGNNNRYIKFGTISSISQDGRSVKITVHSNAGYNASDAQNQETIIRFKTSNNSSNQSGFYGDCQKYDFGNQTGAPSSVLVKQVSTTEFEFYGLFANFTGASSFYTVEHRHGTWTHDGTDTGTTAPTGTVLTATERVIFTSGSENQSATIKVGGITHGASTVVLDGSRNLTNIGTISSGAITVTDNAPKLTFIETDSSNKQFEIGSFGGAFAVYDANNNSFRYIIDGSGNHTFNEGGLSTDFRVESDSNTHMLFVDGGLNRVGIGTASPTEKLTVAGAITTTGALSDDRTSTGAMDFSSGITRFVSYGASGTGGIFAFRTASGGASSTERMRINSGGDILVGTTSGTAVKLNVQSSKANGLAAEIANTESSTGSGIVVKGGNNSSTYSADFRDYNGSSLMRVRGDGNVGIGLTNPAKRLHILAASNQLRIEDGTNGKKYDLNVDANNFMIDDMSAGVNRFTIDNSGRVGIGTQSPSVKLHVYGGTDANLHLRSDSQRSGAMIMKPGTNTIMGSVLVLNDESYRLGTASNYHIRMNQNGVTTINEGGSNVGIGTASPSYKLHVSGSGDTVQYIANSNPSGTNGRTLLLRDDLASSSQDSKISYAATSSPGQDVYFGKRTTSNAGYFHLTNSSGTEHFTVNMASGNTGIGTASPSTRLDVRGGNIMVGGFGGGTDYGLILTPDDGSGYWNVANITGGHLAFNNSATIGSSEKMRIDSSGRVGIGTSSPTTTLQVNGYATISESSNNPRLYLNGGRNYFLTSLSSGLLSIYDDTASQHRLVIDASGNVGIGETSPDKLLHLKSSGATGIAIESTTNAQNLDIDFYNNVGSAQGRIRYAEGSGAFSFAPNVSASDALTIAYDGSATFNSTISSGAITASGKISGGGNVDTTPNADLHIKTSNLGGTSGDQQEIARFQTNLSNGGIIRFYTERHTTGTDWTSAQTKIQQRIDSTDMGYILFNGSGNTYGVELGTHATAGTVNLRHRGTVRLNTVNAGVRVTGQFQIGTTTVIDSSRNLTNIGTISSGAITSSGDITAFSDERIKDNIQTLDGKKALQMRGVSFTKDGKQGSGVIAQEIEKIAPELVATADDEQGTKSVAYGNLVGYLIEAIKEQQDQIEYMKSEIKVLKEANNGNK